MRIETTDTVKIRNTMYFLFVEEGELNLPLFVEFVAARDYSHKTLLNEGNVEFTTKHLVETIQRDSFSKTGGKIKLTPVSLAL